MPAKTTIKRLSAYQQVADVLRESVLCGRFPTGKVPTEKELVAQFGVSLITIRKAVQLLVDENRLVKIRGKGTFIQGLSSQPSRARRLTQVLCYVSAPGFEQHTGNFFNRLMLATQIAAEAHDYNALLASSHPGTAPEPLIKGRVDGLILGGTFDKGLPDEATAEARHIHNDKYLVALAACGFPIVAVSNHSQIQGIHYVYSDYSQMMTKALAEFIENGHHQIGLATSAEKSTAVSAREQAFACAAESAGISPSRPLIFSRAPWKDPELAVRTVISYLQHPECPSALVVTQSRLSIFSEALNALGYRLGQDISIIGLTDNLPEPMMGDPDIYVPDEYTVYAQDVKGLGEQATLRLLDVISGRLASRCTPHIAVPMLYHRGNSIARIPQ